LAVRMRPTNFEGIVGQTYAVAALKGMLITNQIPGTIILTGEPGLGKTSLARIFARYVNCETNSACGKCRNCKIQMAGHWDVTEINMGSDRGIDDIRALERMAKFVPKFKKSVFICDEVHNLTPQAEQAFLKMVEEPPTRTLFILCTSHPEKLTKAMLRRGVVLELKRATVEELGAKLVEIAKKEKVKLNHKSVKKMCYEIADFCNGAIGSAISLLEGLLFAIAGSEGSNPEEIFKKVFVEKQNPVELAASYCCIAFLKLSNKDICKQATSVDSCHQLLMKMRSVAMTIIKDSADNTIYNTYTLKEFKGCLAEAKMGYNPETLAPKMLKLLTCLNSIELKMNLGSGIIEQALFVAELCSLVTAMKEEEEAEAKAE
jgi:DNA polymerase III subunit gamma/tau